MRLIIFILIAILQQQLLVAQEAAHNFGQLKIHEDGALGFYHDFINNGNTDDNLGTVGFFSDESINILGAFRPVFNDMEIMVAKDLFLEVGVRVKNNTNYILGDIVTPRNFIDVNLDYLDNTFYIGNNNLRKIDGFSSLTNKQEFTFPIGDNDHLRPLSIASLEQIPYAKSAYFYDNPGSPTNIYSGFDISQRDENLTSVSTFEFWYLESQVPSWVKLNWDENSSISDFVDDIDNLRVVGWHTINEKWENLGGLKINGNLSSGQITSDTFIPNDYSIITFGSSVEKLVITLGNYILTPNNDGRNDYLEIEGVSKSPNNELKIFNRWGRLVYSKRNYKDSFVGKSNVSMLVQKNIALPDGVYFYIIDLEDINLKYQGYLYLIE